jgi:hypothetical protein
LLVTAMLVGGGWLLTQKISEIVALQNCAIQGRTNCVVIPVPTQK